MPAVGEAPKIFMDIQVLMFKNRPYDYTFGLLWKIVSIVVEVVCFLERRAGWQEKQLKT